MKPAAPNLAPVITVRDLHYRYEDGTAALAGVDFELLPGETVAVFGSNGSGKTTFVLHLNGLLEGQGSIEVCGMPVKKETLKSVRQKIGLVFQDPDDQLFMPSVLEDVAFGPLNLGLSPAEASERARVALEKVGMREGHIKRPIISARDKKNALPSPECWRWTRKSWCSTSRRPSSTPPGNKP